MASLIQGYDEERFATTVNRNFLCLICFNVLRDPVQCPRNQHIFCRGCITKHLENSQRCPTCADPLTVETLTEPRVVKDYLNELHVHCEYVDRGCRETVQLQHLERHEATCGFQPVVCANQGCGVTVSRRDLIHHESELCEFRKLKCHSCGEMSKTLEVMEKRMATMETNVVNVERKITNMETKIEAINNDVKDYIKEALTEVKEEILLQMEEMKEEITREGRPTASGEKKNGNIIVVGGSGVGSVEMFNWLQKLWSPLQSMPEMRWGATSFVYNDHVTIAGGLIDTVIRRMNIDHNLDPSVHWDKCPVELPAKLLHHSSVLYNDHLLVTGGYNGNLETTSDHIDEVQLVPPYAVKTLSRMPEPRQFHCTELFDDNILIVGGSTTDDYEDYLKSVVLYDVKKNECKKLSPLPYEVSSMATVRWGDNIVVIGGRNKHNYALDTVIIYNVKTEQSHMLPPMRYKRQGCAAVVVGNNIVVLGGFGDRGPLKSVESLDFDSYSWKELPSMSSNRWFPTAVVL